ncbi:hypothetical protein NESM_000400300 [Novymonas esmeraldas]|uniref:Uncharacterized protein n=1 Tax=Novymonas esmeraldas TaxID=1808958 RepID=A0AAW0EMC1_9TRYP
MLAVRRVVEPTAVSAVCVLQLVPDAATPAPSGSTAVVLAATAECIHVFDLVPAPAATAQRLSSPPPPQLERHFQPRGHVFNVGCGVSGLVALANQCFIVWTRDQECILVRYQANLAAAPAGCGGVADGARLYAEDGRPTPVHGKEQHWYVVRQLRLWCPDAGEVLPSAEMGVNESKDTVYIRFSERHVFLVSLRWVPSCTPGVRGHAPGHTLRNCRWHTGNYMRAYAGTGFRYPAQSCSVATRRPDEGTEDHQRRLDGLWQSCSPFANPPDEDLIPHHSVGELAQHKEAQSAAAESQYAATSPAAASDDYCGIADVWLRREAFSAPSPLMPSPAHYCASSQSGFVNVRSTGDSVAVHHAPPTLFGSKTVVLRDKHASPHKSAIAVVAPRRIDRRAEWLLVVLVSTDTYTAVYHLHRRHTPLMSSHLVLDGLVHDTAYPRQVLLCSHSDDAMNDVWVALSSGAVSRFSVLTLSSRSGGTGSGADDTDSQWPRTSVQGLPSSFCCRRMAPADDLIRHGGGGGDGPDTSAYPCAARYAIFSDGVQDAYVVDLVECRVVAAMAGDGPMSDVCEVPHGYVTAYARGVLRYLQPGAPLHVCGAAAVVGAPEALHAARVRSGRGDGGVAGGVYVMVSTRTTSQLFSVAGGGGGGLRETTAGGWMYAALEPTLAFAGGSATLAQCTSAYWFVGRAAYRLPCAVSHAAIAEVPLLGLVCVGAGAAVGDAGGALLVVGTGSAVGTVHVPGVDGGPWTCVAAAVLDGDAAMQVALGRWEGGATVVQLRSASRGGWQCVAAVTVPPPPGVVAPVRRLLSLPRAGAEARWMAIHTTGAASVLVVAPVDARAPEASTTVAGDPQTPTWAWAAVGGGLFAAMWAATAVPLLRAAGEVRGGFDGAVLCPRDGSVFFFSAAMGETDAHAPQSGRRCGDGGDGDTAWRTRLEYSVRAALDLPEAELTQASSWSVGVVLESITDTGALAYDLLVGHAGGLVLLALDRHLFTPAQHTTSGRDFSFTPTSPTRYVCTRQISLLAPSALDSEMLLAVVSSPDGEDDALLLCVTVTCGAAEPLTELFTVQATTLEVVDSLVLEGCAAHWAGTVPPASTAAVGTHAAPLFLVCTLHTASGDVELHVVAASPLRIVSSVTLEDVPLPPDAGDFDVCIDGAVHVVAPHTRDADAAARPEVLVAVSVDYGVHLFVLRGYTLHFQHCVVAPGCVSAVELCFPVVMACTDGDTNVYLQLYPVHDTTESLAPSYTAVATRPLKEYGKVSWKMRVEAREPSVGAEVIAQTAMYDRCVRTDVEGDVSVVFASFVPSRSRPSQHVTREDAFVGSADGPQVVLTHAVRLQSVPTKARVVRRTEVVHRRFPRQLQPNGRHITLRSLSQRQDGTSRLLLLPCHDGGLYSACELPYAIAQPLMRLEQVITDAYALDLSASVHPRLSRRLQHTYHLRPFHVVHALQPVTGVQQTLKQACVMVDAVNEYFVLREVVRHRWGGAATTTGESVVDTAAVHRKCAALDDVVQTLLAEEYGGAYTVDDCAALLNFS